MRQSHSAAAYGGNKSPKVMNGPAGDATAPVSLARYTSAPGSLLARVADSVMAGDGGPRPCNRSCDRMSRFFFRDSLCPTSDSDGVVASDVASAAQGVGRRAGDGSAARFGIRQSYDDGGDGLSRDLGSAVELTGESRAVGSHLMRQHSSPAGFFSDLMVENGFSDTRRVRNYLMPTNDGISAMTSLRLKSELSFLRQDGVSQISEVSIPEMGENTNEASGNVSQSYLPTNYSISSWDETNSIVFSSTSKHSRDNNNGEIGNSIDCQYGLYGASVDMAAVDKLLQIQQDFIPFKIRAKRGCATHPRSIAERERRTRISEKLRKLQEIVPNMDKQTSTADMLDLAVQHIKGLQSQIQILKQEQESCTCLSKDEKL
ncbi:hypothetical protein HPP92_024647 [Vanilla planifolia]|uniref:BHLH domain-containing protein n=1 Tax=Vanilla planifolia TaxID=51239 RepID=A0A835PMV9_VANPL|nr:hypothetical protein HPP92_024647 [Vanilla planifolia]